MTPPHTSATREAVLMADQAEIDAILACAAYVGAQGHPELANAIIGHFLEVRG